jgi:hypothetical protein
MVLIGEFNANSQCWAPRCTEKRAAAYWEEIIHDHRLVIGNFDQPTYHLKRNDSEGEFSRDLTLPNRGVGI